MQQHLSLVDSPCFFFAVREPVKPADPCLYWQNIEDYNERDNMKVMGIVKPVTYVHKFKVHLTKLTSMYACLLPCQNDMTNV